MRDDEFFLRGIRGQTEDAGGFATGNLSQRCRAVEQFLRRRILVIHRRGLVPLHDNDGAECARGAIGHVQVRGPNVFRGYWRMPEKNREEFTPDGFFRTGDMGSVSDDGYLTIVGRSKDLIITGGYNVYPKEIELALDELPGVRESAVVGIPHPDFGEAVCAVVVPRKGDAALTEAQVIAALKSKLANFKIPKRVHFVDDLPRNAMGKVQKNVLRERFGTPGNT